jgi:hypothetical protein
MPQKAVSQQRVISPSSSLEVTQNCVLPDKSGPRHRKIQPSIIDVFLKEFQVS